MAWTPDPHLINKATRGGLRNARSLLDIVEHRQQKSALQKIGEMANMGQFNNAGSELIKLGKINAGSQLMNIPYNREQDTLSQNNNDRSFNALQESRLAQLTLGRDRLNQSAFQSDRAFNAGQVGKLQAIEDAKTARERSAIEFGWKQEEHANPQLKPTTAIQNFNYAEKNPAFAEYQSKLRRSGSTNITNNLNNVPLEKRTKGNLQKDIIGSNVLLEQMKSTKQAYKPEFLTYGGQIESFITAQSEKLGRNTTEVRKNFLKDRTKFITNTERLFNSYRKEITGAAAAVQELDRLKKSFINMDMSPSEFEAAYEGYHQELKRVLRLRNKILREGLDTRSQDGGTIMDGLFMSGADDDADARGQELAAKGVSEAEILETLEAEGYDE